MMNFPNGVTVRRFCSIPYKVDSDAGLVVACRNESVGQITGEIPGPDGETEVIELEICEYHRDLFGLDND